VGGSLPKRLAAPCDRFSWPAIAARNSSSPARRGRRLAISGDVAAGPLCKLEPRIRPSATPVCRNSVPSRWVDPRLVVEVAFKTWATADFLRGLMVGQALNSCRNYSEKGKDEAPALQSPSWSARFDRYLPS